MYVKFQQMWCTPVDYSRCEVQQRRRLGCIASVDIFSDVSEYPYQLFTNYYYHNYYYNVWLLPEARWPSADPAAWVEQATPFQSADLRISLTPRHDQGSRCTADVYQVVACHDSRASLPRGCTGRQPAACSYRHDRHTRRPVGTRPADCRLHRDDAATALLMHST